MRRAPPAPAVLGRAELDRLAPALRLLLAADAAAAPLGEDRWQFAVELHFFLFGGVTPTDLRRLLAGGLAQHAEERPASNGCRPVRRITNLSIPPRSCFLLTEAGVRLAESYLSTARAKSAANGGPTLTWDAPRRELRWRDQIVCRFRWAAANQELILASFEELGWPPRIDDPLPPNHGRDRPARLRDTLRTLNRNVSAAGIRFIADGAGRGVVWKRVTRDRA